MEQEHKEPIACRTHRVGSITTGLCMVGFGILFLLHTVFDMMSYQIIFSFWPLILVGLGIELLLSNCIKAKLVYDKTAVFLLIVMTFFVIGLACVDVCMDASAVYLQNYMQ